MTLILENLEIDNEGLGELSQLNLDCLMHILHYIVASDKRDIWHTFLVSKSLANILLYMASKESHEFLSNKKLTLDSFCSENPASSGMIISNARFFIDKDYSVKRFIKSLPPELLNIVFKYNAFSLSTEIIRFVPDETVRKTCQLLYKQGGCDGLVLTLLRDRKGRDFFIKHPDILFNLIHYADKAALLGSIVMNNYLDLAQKLTEFADSYSDEEKKRAINKCLSLLRLIAGPSEQDLMDFYNQTICAQNPEITNCEYRKQIEFALEPYQYIGLPDMLDIPESSSFAFWPPVENLNSRINTIQLNLDQRWSGFAEFTAHADRVDYNAAHHYFAYVISEKSSLKDSISISRHIERASFLYKICQTENVELKRMTNENDEAGGPLAIIIRAPELITSILEEQTPVPGGP